MNSESAIVHPPAKPFPVVRIIGIGSAGIGVVGKLAQDEMPAGTLVAIHSDTSVWGCFNNVEKIEVRRSLGANDLANSDDAGTKELLGRVRALCAGADVVLIVAGMGGLLGNNLSPAIAGVAKEAGAFVLGFAVLPFECEGSRRAELASTGLAKLKEVVDLVLSCPNQQSLSLINEGTTLADTFNAANTVLAGCVRGAWRGFGCENAIGQRFIELCQSILYCSKECCFGVAEAVGPNRALEAVDRLFTHPMAGGATVLPAAKTIAVYVLGGSSLGMAEVNRVMEQFQARCEMSALLMGAANIAALGETLLLAVLVSPATEETDPSGAISTNAEGSRVSGNERGNLGIQLLENSGGERRNSRFLPPPPALPPEKMRQLLKQQGRGGRSRKGQASFRQTQLPLEILSKGRFDKSEPTIHKGEDLDVPTYIRRGMALN